MFHVLVFLLQFVNPSIGMMLDFDRVKILNGEVWRVVTFLFAESGSGGQGALAMLFLFFMVMIAFMMSDALEGAWGIFRTTLFHYTAFVGLLLANFIYPVALAGSGFFVYISAFFAFATLFPRHEFLMFLVIPVQVRWLAMLTGGLIVFGVLAQPVYIGFLLLAFGNYLLWAGIPAMRGRAKAASSASRKRKFNQSKPSAESAFHLCHTCKKTEVSNPELEFRMADDGYEYCTNHLPG